MEVSKYSSRGKNPKRENSPDPHSTDEFKTLPPLWPLPDVLSGSHHHHHHTRTALRAHLFCVTTWEFHVAAQGASWTQPPRAPASERGQQAATLNSSQGPSRKQRLCGTTQGPSRGPLPPSTPGGAPEMQCVSPRLLFSPQLSLGSAKSSGCFSLPSLPHLAFVFCSLAVAAAI